MKETSPELLQEVLRGGNIEVDSLFPLIFSPIRSFKMRSALRLCCAVGLIAFGYVLGNWGVFTPHALRAQDSFDLSEGTEVKIKAAHDALTAAKEALVQENRHREATLDLNAFAVLSGGVDAVADLEAGRGVDPETFAGLYAGKATEEIAEHLSKDEQGRLMYKNKIIRIYPISRLQRTFAERLKLSGLADSQTFP
jgi:hypothetical protein